MESNDNELQASEESEGEIITTSNKCSSSLEKSTINNKQEKISSSSKSKRKCTFNKNWLKDSKYSPFLREY